MNAKTNSPPGPGWLAVLGWSLAGAVGFHLAYSFGYLNGGILIYLLCVVQLTELKSARGGFYAGLGLGMLTFGPQLNFFWNIFGPAAIALWVILSAWMGMFVGLAGAVRRRWGRIAAAILIPVLWTGLEYFRSELYYLRFSWLTVGGVFALDSGWMPLHFMGVYGLGFLLMAVVSAANLLRWRTRLLGLGLFAIALGVTSGSPRQLANASGGQSAEFTVAGFQMEGPSELEVLMRLNYLLAKAPEAKLLVLSEYTFNDGPVPEKVKDWCAKHGRYLIVGGKDPVAGDVYRNTAFVIGPDGREVFKQVKCVPIQFFKDGLPATEQKLWDSPWGKIGICICYDLSYSRVTDELVRLGAQAIIVPTMDVADWGRHQHQLHARVAPLRAAEYGVPIFRLASSGISQSVNAAGRIVATAPMSREGALISSIVQPVQAGTLPFDRRLAPVASATAEVIFGWFALLWLKNLWRKPKKSKLS